MMSIQRILCPVDLSDCSGRALEHAAALARAWSAHLTVAEVYLTASPFDVTPQFEDAPTDDTGLETLRAALRTFVQPVVGDLPVTYRLLRGSDPRRALEAEAADADLMVIGTHGRVGVERFLLGSTTDSIVRKAPCPVLVVPESAASAGPGRFTRILCAIDFSAPSLAAFRYALHLAAPAGAEVLVLHVIDMPPELRDRQIAAAFDVEAVRAGAETAALHRLKALSPCDDVTAVRIAAKVSEGPAHTQILDEAQQLGADLIVLGNHGRGAIDRWLFGSNTAAVLREARCPVLAVRPDIVRDRAALGHAPPG